LKTSWGKTSQKKKKVRGKKMRGICEILLLVMEGCGAQYLNRNLAYRNNWILHGFIQHQTENARNGYFPQI
jgi:hypothetical protein